MPNLVKPRAGPSSGLHTASKPQRRASQAPDVSASLQKDSPPSEKSHAESSSKSPMLPEKKTPVPQVPQFSPLKKSVNKEQTVAAQKNDDTLKSVPSPLKERPTQETSVAQEEKLPPKPSPVKEKRICSDRERILKARKLREMLKEELKKERMVGLYLEQCWFVKGRERCYLPNIILASLQYFFLTTIILVMLCDVSITPHFRPLLTDLCDLGLPSVEYLWGGKSIGDMWSPLW